MSFGCLDRSSRSSFSSLDESELSSPRSPRPQRSPVTPTRSSNHSIESKTSTGSSITLQESSQPSPTTSIEQVSGTGLGKEETLHTSNITNNNHRQKERSRSHCNEKQSRSDNNSVNRLRSNSSNSSTSSRRKRNKNHNKSSNSSKRKENKTKNQKHNNSKEDNDTDNETLEVSHKHKPNRKKSTIPIIVTPVEDRLGKTILPFASAIAAASLDLIQLKSPPTSPNGKLPSDGSQKRRSADGLASPRTGTLERANSVVVTPTATSFSKDELHEIFNFSREEMDVEKSPTKKTSIENMTMSPGEQPHNVALNESNFSMDSSIMDGSFVSQSDNSKLDETVYANRNTASDDNNNTKNGSLTPMRSEVESPVSMETVSPLNKSVNNKSPEVGSRVVSLSKLQMVCREIFMTEKSYVEDLQAIIEGYIYHLKQKGDLDVESIFGNLEDIYEFNKEVLYQIEQCELENYEIDPILMAKVFCDKAKGFNNHYTQYCTKYPEASQFFEIIMQDKGISDFFMERQKVIGHALPLQSYLLKPVQRIMKYHLLFRDILKRYEGDEEGYNTINTAVLAMTDVAEYINEMKRLQENAIKVQEIINNIADLDDPTVDIYATGRLVLENTFKVHGVRSDRIMFLFEKLLLICKKSENSILVLKQKIECCNIMLVESIAKDPLGFQIMRFDDRKVNYTIIAKTLEIKKDWVKQLKRLILENHAAVIPQTARQAILGPEEKAKSKYNSLPMQALDDQINVRHMKKKSQSLGKENGISGVKRESNEKESSLLAKRPLNSKAKEYLIDKKTRGSLSASNLSLSHQQQQPVEKEKKEILKWIRRNKNKPTLDNHILDSPEIPNEIFGAPPERPLVKSRSLESLKDALEKQEEVNNGSNILKDIINYNFEQKLEDAIEQTLTSVNRSRPTSIVKSESDSPATTEGDISPEFPKTIEHLERPDNERLPETPPAKVREQFTSGIKIKKSKSVVMRKKVVGSSDDLLTHKGYDVSKKRWSAIPNDRERLERLEKRLSLLSDDGVDMSIISIKNMVRKVSNAFNSSFQVYNDSPRSAVENDSSVSSDLNLVLGSASDNSNVDYRKSTGGIIDDREPIKDMNRSKSECSGKVISSEEENHGKKDEINTNRWSEDVDQVFDEVNADINSIASSIENNENERVQTESPPAAPTFPVTSVSVDIAQRAALVDQRLKEANKVESVSSPASSKRANVEVKRVADRIKEYKKLIDSEKRRSTWRRRESRTMTEMIENMDNSPSNGSYSHYRRRYRNSRDFDSGNSMSSSSDMSPRNSCSSIKRSLSDTYTGALDNDRSRPMSISTTPTATENATSTDKTLIDSASVLNHSKDKTLNNTEDITTRTERYKKALQNSKNKTKGSGTSATGTSVVLRPRRGSSNEILRDGYNPRDSGEWNRKCQTLPHPKRTNAFKRGQRAGSSEDSNDEEYARERSDSLDEVEDINGDIANETSENTKNNSRRYHRSTSVPRQKKRSVNKVIHEEVHTQGQNTRRSSDTKDEDFSRSRGRRTSGGKQNSDSTEYEKHMSIQRGRTRRQVSSQSDNIPSSHRSISLPRRISAQTRSMCRDTVEEKENLEEKTSSLTIVRTPSIRCIQSNHVNNRIKEYFTNLQKSSQISRSRPNIVFATSNSLSDSDQETSSSDDRISNDEGANNNLNGTNNTDTILKGTVRSMIQRYAKQNYVFDNL